MKVSVLIPCYNQARHIACVVQCITDQTYQAMEIIVVDDASSDDSPQILSQMPVKLICHGENKGPAAARNTALAAARGDVVLYVDADAYANKDLIEVLVHTYKKYESLNSLAGIGGQGIESNLLSVYDEWRALHAPQTFGKEIKIGVPYLYGLCCSFKRSILQQMNGWDTFFRINAGEDADLGFRINRAGYTLIYTPFAKVMHQHSDTYDSLRRVQYNWFFWSYLAKKRNKLYPFTLYAGTLRRLILDTIYDRVWRRNKNLAKLNMELSLVKFKALWDAFLVSSHLHGEKQ